MAERKRPDRSELDALKRAVSLVDIAASYSLTLQPPKQGSENHLARCVLHPDTEASLSIHFSEEEGKWLWNCFGCKTGGDSIAFIRLHEKVDFKTALARLRAFAGTLPPAPEAIRSTPKPPTTLPPGLSRHDLLTTVMAHYQKKLLECPEAQAYLQQRGLGAPELWQTFGLGYADGSLLPTLPRQGDVRLGLTVLGVLNPYGREHLKGCVVVPLYHPDEGLVDLYGRRADPQAKQRHLYLKGPQRGVFNWQALQTASEVTLTEGVLDAMSLWTAGVADVTAAFSASNLPQDLEALLGRFTVRQVRLCLDPDRAGQGAAAAFRTALEAKGITVSQVELPEHDANWHLVHRGPEALRQAVLGSKKPTRTVACTTVDASATHEALANGSPPARTLPPLQSTPDRADTFTLELDEVRYQVTPRPPFSAHLRVLLKAWYQERQHPETLDLYNSRNRTMGVNNLHRVFGLAKPLLEQHFLHILDAAEGWVGHWRPSQNGTAALDESGPPPPVPLTDAERARAMAYLTQPRLMDAIRDDMDFLGTVGEDGNKAMVYLVGTSRKMEKPLAGIILSQSGAGKSSLLQAVCQLMPPEDVASFSRLSPTSPGYMGRYGVKHKLLSIDERVGSEAADYPIRSLLSQGVFTQLVTTKDPVSGKMTTMQTVVEGPMAFLETTTHAEVNEENASRVFELTMTESEEQTARIHAYQRWSVSPEGLSARHRQDDIRQLHHLVQRCLEPLPVAVPYVHVLTFPTRWCRTRRDQARFLHLIMTVAFLHQFQRPRGVVPETGEVYVEATVADYRIAYDLAKTVLAATLHDLPQSCQELWGAARQMLAGRTRGGPVHDEPFTRRELRTYTHWSDRRVRENLEMLVALEYVAASAGSQGKTYHYRLLPGGDEGSPLDQLLTPDALEALLAKA